MRADFLDIVEAGSCNFICELLDLILSHTFIDFSKHNGVSTISLLIKVAG